MLVHDACPTYRLAQEDNWREKYNILIGERRVYPGGYSEHLARSVFCLVSDV